MNRQPYGTPPRWWGPNISPAWIRLTRRFRRWRLRSAQNIDSVNVAGAQHLKQAVAEGKGVLLVANHSAHYDSEALYCAADQVSQPLYFMTAWQVFAMCSQFERWALQWMGCFSIDRESNDRQAFKQGVQILRNEPHPLVIFPEGDIYHTSDKVTPFREGAAAIALSAAKHQRPIVVVPCGIKFWYLDDPTGELVQMMDSLEERVLLRPQPELSIPQRIYRLAEGVLALKELDYLGATHEGDVRERIDSLSNAVVAGLEQKHELKANGSTPQRVKALRQCIIKKAASEDLPEQGRDVYLRALEQDMDDLFFVMQLYSYPGDYLGENPSIERLAETIDKFEEDILNLELPSVRGRRRVDVRVGEPLEVGAGSERRKSVVDLTQTMQNRVQQILNEMSAEGNGKPG